MPIGEPDRARSRSTRPAEKSSAKGRRYNGVQIPPYRKRHGNDFISESALVIERWREKKIENERHGTNEEAGSKKLMPRGERERDREREAGRELF